MSYPVATAPGISHTEAPQAASSRFVCALVLMVANGSLEQTGERVLIEEGETVIIGRHDPARPTDLACFAKHCPGIPMPPPSPAGGLRCPTVSHEQLSVTGTKTGLYVKVIGNRPTLHNGEPFKEGLVAGDDTITLVAEAVLLCIWTPRELPMPPEGVAIQPFGKADSAGLRGESASIWSLRKKVHFAALSQKDVLVIGESGSGKTAVARAVHLSSFRKSGRIIKRSAKQFTKELVESQLFGTAPGFVGSGKQSFDGLLPQTEGGTILLDEIGLAPHWLQEILLSVLDDGVYTVVGAADESVVDVLLIGATNADPREAFRPDFADRFTVEILVPPVREHRDDTGFILRHFLEEADGKWKDDPPSKRRISPTFMDFLLHHPLPTNARQIDKMMHAGLAESPRGHLKLPKVLRAEVSPSSVTRASSPPVSQSPERKRESQPEGANLGGRPKEGPLRTEAEVREALLATGWDVTKAAVRLGISRPQMLRLMGKLGVKRPDR